MWNPNPTLKLGYDIKSNLKRRKLFRQPLEEVFKKPKTDGDSSLLSPVLSPSTSASSPPHQLLLGDHDYFASKDSQKCTECNVKQSIVLYQKKVNGLNRQVKQLKRNLSREKSKSQEKKPFSLTDIKCDEKMNFYTGIATTCLLRPLTDYTFVFADYINLDPVPGPRKILSYAELVYCVQVIFWSFKVSRIVQN